VPAKNPETDQIPFTFLTTKTKLIDFKKGKGIVADDYLKKPLTKHNLKKD